MFFRCACVPAQAIVLLAVVALAAASLMPAVPSLTGVRHDAKPYTSFEEFYPHYQREHTQSGTRALHVCGTAIVTFLVLQKPMLLPAVVGAGSIGYILCGLLAGMATGLVEGATLVVLFLLLADNGRVLKPVCAQEALEP